MPFLRWLQSFFTQKKKKKQRDNSLSIPMPGLRELHDDRKVDKNGGDQVNERKAKSNFGRNADLRVEDNMSLPRGIRNRNPGNIRLSHAAWVGEVKGDDDEFEVFGHHRDGLRALMKLLVNYQKLYGLDTIEKLITRWAPSNENNTNAYVDHVARDMNVPKDQALDLKDHTILIPLAQAIVKHENGKAPEGWPHYWYDVSHYMEAFELATNTGA